MRSYTIDEINRMRTDGMPPSVIAKSLGISVNTIKSHIRRHPDIPNILFCRNCGKVIHQIQGRKPKQFCCDSCRSAYWKKAHRGDYDEQLQV